MRALLGGHGVRPRLVQRCLRKPDVALDLQRHRHLRRWRRDELRALCLRERGLQVGALRGRRRLFPRRDVRARNWHLPVTARGRPAWGAPWAETPEKSRR
jgi:hypothetical protein